MGDNRKMVCERFNALIYGTFFLYYKNHSNVYGTLATAQNSLEKIQNAEKMTQELQFLKIRINCEVGIEIIFCVMVLNF